MHLQNGNWKLDSFRVQVHLTHFGSSPNSGRGQRTSVCKLCPSAELNRAGWHCILPSALELEVMQNYYNRLDPVKATPPSAALPVLGVFALVGKLLLMRGKTIKNANIDSRY